MDIRVLVFNSGTFNRAELSKMSEQELWQLWEKDDDQAQVQMYYLDEFSCAFNDEEVSDQDWLYFVDYDNVKKENAGDGYSDTMQDKLSWLLQSHYNTFHADMIQRAMNDDSISAEDFIKGCVAIHTSERDTDDDEFTPTQFQNDWKEQMQDKMRDYVLHHGENHSDYEQKVVWDHYGCFCRLLIGDRMWDMYRIIPHTDGHVEFDFVDEDGNDLDKNLMNLSVEQIQIIAKALNIK